MKTYFPLFVALLCISFTMKKMEKELRIAPCILEKSVKDFSLKTTEAVYKFNFKNITDNNNKRSIRYSIDGIEGKAILVNNAYLEFTLKPGKHIFQFYYNSDYEEIYSDSLLIKSQRRDDYSVNMELALEFMIVDKPVIYIYPESESVVEVKLRMKGTSLFTYPAYNDGWKFNAQPDGTLTFGEKEFNYLFWESQQIQTISTSDHLDGFVVKGAETISFLEEKLTLAGLNSKEQADFITYWGPRLSQNERNFVHFEFNETCNKYAELDITPQPDQIYRIYMLWTPIEDNYPFIEQEIIPMNREGFSVLEWGGSQINLKPLVKTQEL